VIDHGEPRAPGDHFFLEAAGARRSTAALRFGASDRRIETHASRHLEEWSAGQWPAQRRKSSADGAQVHRIANSPLLARS
jgi:hypothetical protein